MLRILRRNKVAFITSSQTHCDENSVSEWICKNANNAGDINDVSVECFGRVITIANVSQAHIVAAIFAADHNDYVEKNLKYPVETAVCTSPREEDQEESETLYSKQEDPYDVHEIWKIEDASYELNEELLVNDFGPARTRERNM
jgi:hypothetical protein